MNLFILLRNSDGSLELVTPPLDTGVILPGVTRRSIVEMVSTWPGVQVTERRITMKEVMAAHSEGRLVEMFGSGTAAVVSPVGGLHYEGQMVSIPTPEDGLAVQIMAAMSDIYYGRVASPWAIDVEEWNVDPNQVQTGDTRVKEIIVIVFFAILSTNKSFLKLLSNNLYPEGSSGLQTTRSCALGIINLRFDCDLIVVIVK